MSDIRVSYKIVDLFNMKNRAQFCEFYKMLNFIKKISFFKLKFLNFKTALLY